MSLHRSGAFSAERGQSQAFSESKDERLAESLTMPERSEYWPLDERDTVLGFPLIFSPQHRAKADISTLAKADIFILGRHRNIDRLSTGFLIELQVLSLHSEPEGLPFSGSLRHGNSI